MIALGFALRLLAPILVPFVLAVFLMLMIDAAARLQRRHLPSWPHWTGTLGGILALVLAVLLIVFVLTDQAGSVVGQSGRIMARVDSLLNWAAQSVGSKPVSVRSLVDGPAVRTLAGSILSSVQGFAGGLVLVIIYLGFLLASRSNNRLKFTRLFSQATSRTDADRVVTLVRRGTEEYVWVQTVTGLMIAVTSWLAMVALGLENAALLALIVFLTSYIPVVGPLLGVTVPALFALVQFTGLREPLILFVALQAVNFLVNNLLVPRMQSERLNLDPTVLLLGLGFWSFLWGLPGALLATPLMVAMLAIAANVPTLRWVAVLFSKNGDLSSLGDAKTDGNPAQVESVPAGAKEA